MDYADELIDKLDNQIIELLAARSKLEKPSFRKKVQRLGMDKNILDKLTEIIMKKQKVEESGTVRFTPLIQELRSQGKDIIDFSVGDVHLPTPKNIIKITKQALDKGMTKYSSVQGLIQLRKKIGNPEEVIITNGSKQALFNIFQILCRRGEQVIIPRPYWPSFPEQVKLAGGVPVVVDTINHQPDIEAIEKSITKKTKAILLNSPNNPTGAVYKNIDKIAKIAAQHKLHIILDRAYDKFVYIKAKKYGFKDFPKEKLITVGSFSKIYGMSGFRVGYAIASKEFIKEMRIIQSHSTGNVCTFAQYGAMAALDTNIDIKEFQEKRNLAYKLCSEIFDCIKPEGAFYLFPDVNKYLKRFASSEDLAKYLLDNGVAVVPGEVFGAPGNIRICCATSKKNIVEGFKRIKSALN